MKWYFTLKFLIAGFERTYEDLKHLSIDVMQRGVVVLNVPTRI